MPMLGCKRTLFAALLVADHGLLERHEIIVSTSIDSHGLAEKCFSLATLDNHLGPLGPTQVVIC